MKRYREIAPHAALRDIVRCFWFLEAVYPEDGVQDVHPDGCVELMFNFGSPYVPARRRKPSVLPAASVLGFQNRTVRFRVNGTVRVVAARLHPWGALLFIGDNAATLSDSVRGLGPDWASLSRRLERLVGEGEYEGAVDALQGHLLRTEITRTYYLHVIQAAAKLLHRSMGECTVTDLADRCRLGVRQLQRGFRRVVGTSPKAFARTVRFDRALRALMLGGAADLTRLAYECGYSDQAHFSRDFKELCGQPPSRYARSLRGLWKSLEREDVVFLQAADPGPS